MGVKVADWEKLLVRFLVTLVLLCWSVVLGWTLGVNLYTVGAILFLEVILLLFWN